ncbi:amidohydrolase family protein [Acetobacteraceae bacterium AT-5844]|nr:amidohydrolase family protein [Acetobacteraceae bacterium AT-5844]
MTESHRPTVLRAAAAWTGEGGPVFPAIGRKVELHIEAGRITWLGREGERPAPPAAILQDLGDAWLLPGFIDAHLHLWGLDLSDPSALWNWPMAYRAARAVADLGRMLEEGVTAVRCLGGPLGPSLARAVQEGVVRGPHIVAAGEFICSRAGTWDHAAFPQHWVESLGMYADGADACRQRVRERIRQGADFIKVGGSVGEHTDALRPWGNDPARLRLSYSDGELAVLVEEAHRNGLRVASHAIGDEAVRQALECGVDTIEHGHGISDETARRMADRGALLVPTLSLPALRVRHPVKHVAEGWQRHRDAQRASLQLALRHGVRIAAGTDFVGPPGSPLGPSMMELELLVEAGLTPEQALVAGTAGGAEALGMQHRIGRLAEGFEADMVALPGDPRADIGLVRQVRFVMKGGEVVRG